MSNLTNKGILALSMIFMIMLFTGLASAEKVKSYTADEDQLELAKELHGTDITYGEYIKQVFPEAYKESPSTSESKLCDMKMVWPKENDGEKTITSSYETNVDSNVKSVPIPWVMYANSRISASGSEVEFNSWQQIMIPVGAQASSMSVTSFLYDEDETLIALKLKEGTNVNKVEAKDSFSVTTSGDYQTRGAHYVTWPPGYWPQTGSTVTSSSWKYVSV